MDHVGIGYGLPYAAMLPVGIDNLITAGRCVSADAIAFGSTRNVPACTMTGEAAAIGAALAASRGIPTSAVPVADVQARLRQLNIWLGTPGETVPELLRSAV
jgi:hypothetical protein